MRAIVLDGPGPPEALQIRDVPIPQPEPGWVLIRVRAFGLNFSELHLRQGAAGNATFPRIPGKGWTFKTIVQGSSIPQVFIPTLIELWQQGRFPVDRLTKSYAFGDINTAFDDSLSGAVIKPVLMF